MIRIRVVRLSKKRGQSERPRHARHQQCLTFEERLQPRDDFDRDGNAPAFRGLIRRAKSTGQIAGLARLSPAQGGPLSLRVPIERSTHRFGFEKRIEITGHAIRAQVRADLPQRV